MLRGYSWCCPQGIPSGYAGRAYEELGIEPGLTVQGKCLLVLWFSYSAEKSGLLRGRIEVATSSVHTNPQNIQTVTLRGDSRGIRGREHLWVMVLVSNGKYVNAQSQT